MDIVNLTGCENPAPTPNVLVIDLSAEYENETPTCNVCGWAEDECSCLWDEYQDNCYASGLSPVSFTAWSIAGYPVKPTGHEFPIILNDFPRYAAYVRRCQEVNIWPLGYGKWVRAGQPRNPRRYR